MPAEAITAATVATPIVKGMLEAFGRDAPNAAARIAKKVNDRAVSALQIGFETYLTTTYNKCRVFKSILAPGKPQDVVEKYVSINLKCHDIVKSDTDLISTLSENKRVVITGLAGSGKSMFMKYYCVYRFLYPDGTIPLFVELRQLNNLSDIDLIAYIRSSTASRRSAITENQFLMSLEGGSFVLILDGFDELNHEIRDQVQSQILELEKDYPRSTVIVSSRPDPRFGSWTSYHVYSVEPLAKQQTIKLIDNLEYDNGVKKRFSKAVNDGLFDSHRSFLSSPLLTSIMLLTFEEFAEIPQRMHEFYSQAFDTLLQKHDAQKEQYQRQTHSNLTREEFRSCFAAFCAMSYVDHKFSFDDASLNSVAESALKYVRQTSVSFKSKITASQFIEDLRESVCMLQPDGTEMAFVHRSFQEYFTALFVTSLHGERVGKFLDRCALRYEDSVIAMSADMAREVVEKEWAVSAIDAVLNHEILGSGSTAKRLMSVIGPISMFANFAYLTSRAEVVDAQVIGYIESLSRMYPNKIRPNSLVKPLYMKDTSKIASTLSVHPEDDRYRAQYLSQFLTKAMSKAGRRSVQTIEIDLNEDDSWWLDSVGYDVILSSIKDGLSSIKKDMGVREKRRSNILEELLSS